ncbi:hypothetical protein [Rivularia sp. UHCC 0363]|uniref:hypothetical protein n=1 Tax=Rivularia sp. UHCC 0363 TaxID=3110244 RepID=UPI002B1F8AF4|nr:hypothetical protein [Rivularia sp. UHCC 0363]MEA5594283.1 hypothetical protein [Rivularia sp. UHCC 0363]
MRKSLIASGIGLLVIASVATIAIAEQKEPKQNPRPEWANKKAEIEVVSTPTDNYLYPDNSSKTERQLIKKNDIIKGKLRDDLILKGMKLVKYSDFIDSLKSNNGDIIQDMQIHPSRLVWVADIEAPKGIEVPQKNSERVKFKKSKIAVVFDAETGEKFGTSVVETP